MAALSLAALYPDMAQRLLAIACTARSSPGSVALRSVQRQAVLSDPDYQGGNYYDSGALRSSCVRVCERMRAHRVDKVLCEVCFCVCLVLCMSIVTCVCVCSELHEVNDSPSQGSCQLAACASLVSSA